MTIEWKTIKLTNESFIEILQNQQDWVTSTFLSEFFNTTPRTIRNYVARINRENQRNFIESSYKGYRINNSVGNRPDKKKKPELNRPLYIIRKLINSKNEINFYDLAEELFISESTFYNDLKQAKSVLTNFSLTINRIDEHIYIKGSERNKRKLIYHLLSIENKNNFIAFTENGFISELQIDQPNLRNNVLNLFIQKNFYINDFGLNNLIMHLLVIIDRIKKGKQISESISIKNIENSTFFEISIELKSLLESSYDLAISNAELYYLTLIIAANCNTLNHSLITSENIHKYIDKQYITITQEAIKRLEEIYYLEPFDNSFMANFTIHIANMIQRAKNKLYMKNPLTFKTKTTYPLIYDMAVFLASEICDINGLSINEDEITFIAFYIGTYLEKIKNRDNKITCTFLYAEYHNMHFTALSHLEEIFKNDLDFVNIIPINEVSNSGIENDVIISTVDSALDTNPKFIRINIFPSNQDINLIKSEINAIRQQRKNDSVNENIKRFIGKELFKKEFYTKDKFEMIKALTKECCQMGLCKSSFTDEVIERENLSSTSFSNFVAVPHSLELNAIQSFMSVVINKKSMQWGQNSVNIIILIGISKEDRSAFREIFNDLIIILCEPIYVNQIIKCNDYNVFIDTITQLLSEQSILKI